MAEEEADGCLQTAIAVAEKAKNALAALKQRLGQLQDAQGKPTCAVCGQSLTPGHIEEEIGKVEAQIQGAQESAKKANGQRCAAGAALEQAKKTVKDLSGQIGTQSQRRSEAQIQLERADGGRKRTEADAARAIQDLRTIAENLAKLAVAGKPYVPEPVVQRLLPAPKGGLADILQHGTYPSDGDVAEMEAQSRALKGADAEFDALKAARQEASRLDAEIRSYEAQIQDDEEAMAQAAQKADLTAIMEVKALAENSIAQEIGRFAELATVPDLNDRQRKAKEALAHVRAAAEKPAAKAKDTIEQCKKQKDEREQQSRDARQRRDSLAGLLEKHHRALNEHTETARQALVHRTLEQKLDRNHLRYYLRTTADQAIVANADAILQRLSDGMLHLSLQEGTGRTLDLRVTDYEKGERAMLPAALSGSQKFRVSVALALGIGQYACGLRQGGIQSVIIDEGFGSLDKEGREKMIEELQNLEKMLERIIVVSHQEEFESAFPHRWHISVQGGTARAEMIT